MTTTRRRRVTASLAAGMALSAAACATPATGDRPDPTPGATSQAEADAGRDAESPATSSPLGDFLDAGAQAPDEADADRERQRYHELVAACMAEEGFDYHAPRRADRRPGAGPFSLPPEQFAQRYGYGITTIDRSAMPEVEDPNEQMLAGMSVAERTAWHRALRGDVVALDDDGNVDPRGKPLDEHPADLGCGGEAAEHVWGGGGVASDDEEFASLFDDMGRLYERIEGDPRIRAAVRSWSDCMAERGHAGLEDTDDPHARIQARLDELAGVPAASTEPADVPQRRVDVEVLAGLDPAELQELRDAEVAMAVADLECADEADVEGVRHAVQVELETAFVEEHRDRLEAYRSAIGGTE